MPNIQNPQRPTVAAVAARLAAQAVELHQTKTRIDEMGVKVDGLAADLQKFLADPALTAPVKHRKHVALGKVVRDLKLRIAELEKRDPAAPGYAEAVNVELARLGKRVDDAYAELEGRVSNLETTVADHGQRLDFLDPAVAAHTAEIEGLKKLEPRMEEVEATVAALASAGPGSRKTPWAFAGFSGLAVGGGAAVVTHFWTDLSTGWAWFVSAVIAVAAFLVAASFDKVTDGNAVAAASARMRSRASAVPPPQPTPQGGEPAQNPPVNAGTSS